MLNVISRLNPWFGFLTILMVILHFWRFRWAFLRTVRVAAAYVHAYAQVVKQCGLSKFDSFAFDTLCVQTWKIVYSKGDFDITTTVLRSEPLLQDLFLDSRFDGPTVSEE